MKGMTLEEAIKYNEELKRGIDAHEMPKHYAAVQLGIEGLKRIQDARDIEPKSPAADLLPGETEGEK